MPRICCDEGCDKGKKEHAVPASEECVATMAGLRGIDGRMGDRASIDIDLRPSLSEPWLHRGQTATISYLFD